MANRTQGAASDETRVAGQPAPDGNAERATIRIFVELEPKEPPVRLEFESDQVTGRTLKERAGVPLENDLARRQGQKLELVTNEETITIANGERFVSLPPGTIS